MRRMIIAALAAAGFAAAASAQESPAQLALWSDLVTNVFDGRAMEDGSSLIALEAPNRAEDAAIVPLTVRLTPPAELDVRKLTLVIDENPSPVAAEFEFGPERDVHAISMRVRVDKYSNIHAVAELSDGKLYSVARFVKAAGGCSAPAMKNPGEVSALGEMRFRWFDAPVPASDGLQEAQLMIRHPNNSGLQRDPINNYYIPAYFVRSVAVSAGPELLFRMEGGISISENPTFRFTYSGGGTDAVTAEAIDTKEQVFRGSWPGPEADAS